MRFEAGNAAEAESAIEYFNAFHDGFIRELRLSTHDRFPERGVHETGERPDLELVFGHYNYERDTRPADQLVRASFRGVMQLETELTGLATEAAVKYVAIEDGTRRREDGSEEPCLRAVVVASRLDGDEWREVEAIRFSFERAVIEER